MRLGITGTYSSGKTFTSLVVSNYLGMSRTEASTMREILPFAAPGKTLDECSSAQLIQMIVVRHTERVLHESRLAPEFVSDGCSLQEWIYGSVRVKYGVNPNASVALGADESVPLTDELAYFEEIMSELGKAFKRHVKRSFDMFVHLRNELPLAKDGHRPVNEKFRTSSDELLQKTLVELDIPFRIIGGTMEERANLIAQIAGKSPVRDIKEAINMASDQYGKMLM
jgi:AAA domain